MLSKKHQFLGRAGTKIVAAKTRCARILLALLLICGLSLSDFSHTLFASRTTGSSQSLSAPRATAASRCDDLYFIFARGSGAELNDSNNQSWETAITAALRPYDLTYSFYQLGSSPQAGFQYPATAIHGELDSYRTLIGAYLGAGNLYDFGASVHEGIRELVAYISITHAVCRDAKFVLGGYSQGAMVISGALQYLDPSQIVYAATFGDPKLYLPEGAATSETLWTIPEACYGRNLSNYRLDVADCFAYEGILGSYRPYQPEGFLNKLGAWCKGQDIMCSTGLSLSDHISYDSDNVYADAAQVIASKIQQTLRPATVHVDIAKPLHELVILLDTTGSMSAMLSEYKAEAINLARKVMLGGGRVALYTYGDALIGESVVKYCDFSDSLSCVSTALDGLIAGGGGDTPESVLHASATAMQELKWTNGATKSLIILTDSSYHTTDAPYCTGETCGAYTTQADVVRISREIDPVNFYVLSHSDQADVYQELTAATGGAFFDFNTELSLTTNAITERPIARLQTMTYAGLSGAEFTFDASPSYSPAGEDLSFTWDFDGDGVFETPGSALMTVPITTERYVSVQVQDESGLSSTMSALVKIIDPVAELSANSKVAEITALTASFGSDVAGTSVAGAEPGVGGAEPGAAVSAGGAEPGAAVSAGGAEPGAAVSAGGAEHNIAEIHFTAAANRVFLAINDALVGELELSLIATQQPDGTWQGTFALGEITTDTVVTLIPYYTTRGLSAQITLQVGAEQNTISKAEQNTISSAGHGANTNAGQGALQVGAEQNTISGAEQGAYTNINSNQTLYVPTDKLAPLDTIKVPNTGVRR